MSSVLEARVPALNCAVRFAVSGHAEVQLLRSLMVGRVSGARLPRISWRATEASEHDVFVDVDDRGDDVEVRFRGAVDVGPYMVDKAGAHWDLSKVLVGTVIRRLLERRIVALHAAVVRVDGRAVLMPGISGAGKSSVAFRALAVGHDVLASELTFATGAYHVVGNALATIDAAALQVFDQRAPDAARELDRRVVVDLPTESARLDAVVFPKVTAGGLRTRAITARRARMLLYENALGQLPFAMLLDHERQPMGAGPTADELKTVAQAVMDLSELGARVVEGTPQEIVRWLEGIQDDTR